MIGLYNADSSFFNIYSPTLMRELQITDIQDAILNQDIISLHSPDKGCG